MKMDKISIIVPVYNVKQYLSRCVKSILEQTYSNLEIILVDDGSTDGSSQLCDTFHDPRIIVIHKKNEGLGLSRNAGISSATGKYLMFVDSDDYIDCTMVENLYNDLIASGADTCIGGFKRVYGSKTINNINPLAGKTFSSPHITGDVLTKMMGKDKPHDDHIEMSVWKVLFSSSVIHQNKLKFPSERKFISEDIIFDAEYYPKCKRVVMSSDIGYNYCDNDGSLTTKYNPNRFNLQLVLFRELSTRTKKLEIYDSLKQRLFNTLISNTRYCIKQEAKFNTQKEAISRIKKICYNPMLKKVNAEYEVNENYKSQVVNYLIQKKHIYTLYLVMKIKNKYDL